MRTIGITGGVGSGKSSILDYLSAHYNCVIIKADELAGELKLPGKSCYDSLVSLLGAEVLTEDGTIDNKKMAKLVFQNEALLKQVNEIIHPKVKEEILKRINDLKAEGKIDFFFLEAALLIEDHYDEILDEIWYVYASEKVRRKRLKKSRGYSDEKIDSIMQSQLPEEEFRKHTDFVINNSGSKFCARFGIRRKMKELMGQ